MGTSTHKLLMIDSIVVGLFAKCANLISADSCLSRIAALVVCDNINAISLLAAVATRRD